MNKARLGKTQRSRLQHHPSRRVSKCSRSASTKWEASGKKEAATWREELLTKLLLPSQSELGLWHSRTWQTPNGSKPLLLRTRIHSWSLRKECVRRERRSTQMGRLTFSSFLKKDRINKPNKTENQVKME